VNVHRLRRELLALNRRYLDTVHDARRGIIFYAGSLTLPMGDQIWAGPLQRSGSRRVTDGQGNVS
jgi:hypothetical protein